MARTMIPFEQAFDTVMDHVRRLPAERVELAAATGRVLAEPVSTDMDFPPFDKACMDGFACRREDLGQSLEVVETVAAGVVPTRSLGPGQATKIMTGAMVPEGADVVFMVEYSEEAEGDRIRFNGAESADNISPRGEDLHEGDTVLESGTLLAAQHVAVLASVGATEPLVSVRPRVGIIATGDELVEPGCLPRQGQIRNSNSHQLFAQTIRAGAVPTYYGIAADRPESIEGMLRRALPENDLVLLSGGVSMGDFDLVPEIITRCGLDIRFDQVAIKPGKPVTFAVGEAGVCFGMPGNPVSTFVIFETFVRPFLQAMMGCTRGLPEWSVRLGAPLVRRRTERMEFVPVSCSEEGEVLPIRYHGSAHFVALARADGLVAFPVGVARLDAGTVVKVRTV
jgi:molybdopterin molybdotransferase